MVNQTRRMVAPITSDWRLRLGTPVYRHLTGSIPGSRYLISESLACLSRKAFARSHPHSGVMDFLGQPAKCAPHKGPSPAVISNIYTPCIRPLTTGTPCRDPERRKKPHLLNEIVRCNNRRLGPVCSASGHKIKSRQRERECCTETKIRCETRGKPRAYVKRQRGYRF